MNHTTIERRQFYAKIRGVGGAVGSEREEAQNVLRSKVVYTTALSSIRSTRGILNKQAGRDRESEALGWDGHPRRRTNAMVWGDKAK